MDTELYALLGKYGFKAVHSRLHEIMREEYEYMKEQFESLYTLPLVVKEDLLPVIQSPLVVQAVHVEPVKKTKQIKKQKKSESEIKPESEVKDVIVTVIDKQFRDQKEVREFQKAAEEAKRKENEAAGIQLVQILTKENLKKWIEEEGHTYAWVAREKAGCADTQVAAQAQMMGITSKITRKRGMIITNRK